MTPTLTHAILSLRPHAQWTLRGDDLEWLDLSQSQPSAAELTAELTRLQNDYIVKQYQRDRAKSYPPIGDQLDAIWKGGDAEIAMRAMVLEVKAQYPKP